MKKLILAVIGAVVLSAGAHAQMLTISEVYGGGGNAGATYTNDFIELYNYGLTPIDLSLYSVFYTSATGAFNTASTTLATPLTGSIAPLSYFLIGEAAGTGGTTPLPGPNVVGVIALSGTAGKVALALTSTATITAANSAGVVDFVGYGTTANLFEGAGPTAAPSNTTSVSRVNPAIDTNNNSVDFAVGAPSPVPEPATYAYVLAGLGVLALGFRRHRAA